MRSIRHRVGALLVLLLPFVVVWSPTPACADILIVAPHPDDDIIMAAGVIQRALQRGEPVRIVYVTNGDYDGTSVGAVRQAEAVAGVAALGLAEDRLIFLGYPDGGIGSLFSAYQSATTALTSHAGLSATYATRGLGRTDYHRYRFHAAGAYNWPTLVGDLADIIGTLKPTHIFTTSQWDTHSDHSTTYRVVSAAVLDVISRNASYNPTIHKTAVWPGDDAWPAATDPTQYFTATPRVGVTDPRQQIWAERESLDVPLAMQSTSGDNPKYLAVQAHASQGGVSRYIGRWIKKDEIFWTEQLHGDNQPPVPHAGVDQVVDEAAVVVLDGSASRDRNGDTISYQWRQVAGPAVTLSSATTPRPTFTAPSDLAADASLQFELVVSDGALSSVPDAITVRVRSALPPPVYGRNVAPTAVVTASSERAATGQTAIKVIDGVVDGYPRDGLREWVTGEEGAGAWLAMKWRAPVTIGKIVLFDRPNTADQLMAGVITFSDGSRVPVTGLANDGTGVEFIFTPRQVTSLRLVVTQVSPSTGNIGLAEVQVFELGPANQRPVADAGDAQVVFGAGNATSRPRRR